MSKNFSLDKIKLFFPLILVFIIIFGIYFIKYVNYRFGTNNITKAFTNSRFAGYAVFINKKQLLTTYDLTETTCKDRNIYILYNDNYYSVSSIAKDVGYRLSVLELKNVYNIENFKNYALISNSDNYKKLFTVKSSNDYFDIDLQRVYFKHIDNYLYKKSFDVFRQRQGAPLLDNNLSLYGLITGKTKSGLTNMFSNEINAIDNNYIRKFLDKKHIEYRINPGTIDLKLVKNYKDKIIVKVVCTPITKRIPRTITLPR